jgi:hypothetical protein
LTWTDGPEETLHFDGDNDDALGVTRGGTFYCAIRLTPSLPCSLKSVLFYHADPSYDAAVYVYGPGTDTTPGAVLDSAQYSGAALGWLRVNFAASRLMLADRDLWLSVRCRHDSDFFPMGIDAGPMVRNRGGFYSPTGSFWLQLADIGSNTNANIRAIVVPVNLNQDLGVLRLLAPRGFVPGGQVQPAARVKNYGLQTIVSANVVMTTAPGGYSSTQPVTGLAPGESTSLLFDDWAASGGFYSVRCTTELNGDLNPANDLATATALLPDWTQDFEAGNGGYVPDCYPTPGWVWGAPASPRPAAHSGTKVWGAPLTGDYADNADWNLYSRVYTANIDSPAIAFYHWYRTENGTDGGNFCYSLDTGRTWQFVTPWPDYSHAYDGPVYSLGSDGYTGNRLSNWEVALFRIPVLNGTPFQLRWRFTSDNSTSDKGWIIDDVSGIGVQTLTAIAESSTPDPRPLTPALSVSPNPVSALTRIAYSIPTTGPVSLRVYDASGKLVSVLACGSRPIGDYVYRLSPTAYRLSPGVYLLELRTAYSRTATKLVVQ